MAMDLKEIESLIKETLTDATIEIQDLAGDGNHYSATITSSQFSGKSKIDLESATKILQENSVHFDELGSVNDDSLIIDDKTKVSIDDLIKSHTNWLTNYMEN